jgi:hypothetical protein
VPPWSAVDLEQSSALIDGHVLPSSSARRTLLNVLNSIHLYQYADLFSLQGGCLPAMKATSMEVPADPVRRKGQRMVTGENVTPFTLCRRVMVPFQ